MPEEDLVWTKSLQVSYTEAAAATGFTMKRCNSVAWSKALHQAADRLDITSNFMAGYQGRVYMATVRASSNQQIVVADTAGSRPHQDLVASRRVRIRDDLELKYLRTTDSSLHHRVQVGFNPMAERDRSSGRTSDARTCSIDEA